MKKEISTALIGYGKAADMHAKALLNIPENKLAAVCGRSDEKASLFAQRYKINAYTDIREMVTTEKIDLVIVCTPHPNHKDATLAALRAGSNVLVEKPLASSIEDCDAMIDMAAICKRKLGVVSQRRFFPASLRIKKAIEEKKIGEPMLGTITMLGWRNRSYYEADPWRGTWSGEGGGVLVNQAPHQLDLLQWYMGSEIEELYGVWKNINHPYIEVEDTAAAIIRFKNGAIANILVSNAQDPGIYGKVHVHGSNGASVGVQTDGGAMFIAGMSTMQQPPKNDLWTVKGEEHFLRIWEQEDSAFFSAVDPVEYYIRQQQLDFIKALLNDQEPLISGGEGKKTVEIFTAIYRSMQENKPIRWPLATVKR